MTPANPSVAKGLTQQFTATGTYTDSSHAEPHQPGDLGVGDDLRRDDQRRRRAGDRRGRRALDDQRDARRRSAARPSLTVTAAALQSIAVTPANPDRRQGAHPAVHRDRHLHRQLDAGPHEPGDLGLGHDLASPRSPTPRALGRPRWPPGTSSITRDARRDQRLDRADRHRRGAPVDRGDSGQLRASPRGRPSSSRRPAPSPTARRRTSPPR